MTKVTIKVLKLLFAVWRSYNWKDRYERLRCLLKELMGVQIFEHRKLLSGVAISSPYIYFSGATCYDITQCCGQEEVETNRSRGFPRHVVVLALLRAIMSPSLTNRPSLRLPRDFKQFLNSLGVCKWFLKSVMILPHFLNFFSWKNKSGAKSLSIRPFRTWKTEVFDSQTMPNNKRKFLYKIGKLIYWNRERTQFWPQVPKILRVNSFGRVDELRLHRKFPTTV